ncbi:MAG: LEA type 2 family protein [Gammaproteobacteria bacterium]|nr:LEA type 2 family protein [Gammaproteobacteria bacterium]
MDARNPGRRLVAALLMLIAGCALRPNLQPPQLSVLDVQLESLQLWQQRLRLRVHVENPNDRALAVQGLTYTLEVEGQPVANGAAGAPFTVPARGAQDFDLEVTANLAPTLIALLGRIAQADAAPVPYHLSGEVTLSAGWLRHVPFDARGSFSLH